ENSLSSAQTTFGSAVVPVQLPIGAEKSFNGFIDLLSRQAYQFGDGKDGSVTPIDIPADLADAVETHRTTLVEKICENDEELMMRYLEDDEISVDELKQGLRTALLSGEGVPVSVSAATACKGIGPLLDAMVDYFPSPSGAVATDQEGTEIELSADPDGPLAALVFKTIADPYVGKLSFFRVYSGTLSSDSHAWDTQKAHDERIGQVYVMRGKEQISVPAITAGDIGAV